MRSFQVADLTAAGQLRSTEPYGYAELEQLPGAAELIGHLSGQLWRSPDEFETRLLYPSDKVTLRWRAFGGGCGLATLREGDQVLSLSLLASGQDESADQTAIQTLQQRLLSALHDTGFEPAFGLMGLKERPLVATVNVGAPTDNRALPFFAIADRCFAAAYFRYLRLL